MDANQTPRLFARAGALRRDGFGASEIRPGRQLNIMRSLGAEILEGRHEGTGRKAGSAGSINSLSRKLHSLTGPSRKLSRRTPSQGAGSYQFDKRQRAVVKIHYFNHGGSGGAALRTHARYIARDAAGRSTSEDRTSDHEGDAPPEKGQEQQARTHARYLTGAAGERARFYDAENDQVNGGALAARWASRDRRHFRIILAAENGSRLDDLKRYTRAVMARAELALGTRLEWTAVDHWDTDNPHTHIILRGRRRDGSDLVIPREYVKHGFRSAARDVATERLGERSREDERLALQREARAHRPTRLDPMIADQLDGDGQIRIAHLKAPSGAPELSDALRARAHELKALGLAQEVRRNVLRFEPGWRDQLKAMELHLDIRKSLMQERAQNLSRKLAKSLRLGPGQDR
jgi:type IV secretory pathway VirD2 relaxase